MAKIRDVLTYFCRHYPTPGELSKARITKMIYLADWRSAITRGRQLTGIRWHYNHYGPYVSDVVETAERHPEVFRIVSDETLFGNPKEVIELADPDAEVDLSDDEKEILDHVIRTTQKLYWADFIRLVYSTYPIIVEPRYAQLDLVALARRYQAERQAIRQAAAS